MTASATRRVRGRGLAALATDWYPADLPRDVRCETAPLITDDGGVTRGTLYHRGGEDTVVTVMHPRIDTSRVPFVLDLLAGGYAVFTQNSRDVGNDLQLVHENTLLDAAAGVAFLRDRGFGNVVALANSGGAGLYTYYQEQAELNPTARFDHDASGAPTSLPDAQMPTLDAIIYLAPHPGQGELLMSCIDPSVIDEGDPLSVDPSLDPHAEENGFSPEGSCYATDFIERYRAAQRQRVARLDERAREHVARGQAARRAVKAGDTSQLRLKTVVPILLTHRTDADLRATDLSIDPSDRAYGSVFGPRPYVTNFGLGGFGRITTPASWLSTWSGLSSRANIYRAGPGVTCPVLAIEYTGDNAVFPGDVRRIVDSLGGDDLTHARVRGNHYGRPLTAEERPGRMHAMELAAEWLAKRFSG